MKKCYFYDNTEIKEPVQVGIDWLFKTAKSKKYHGVMLAVNVMDNLYTISKYDASLNVLKELDTPSRVCAINGLTTHLLLNNQLVSDGMNMPLLAVHPAVDYLVALDQIPSVPEMLVIPWNPVEINEWIRVNDAIFLHDAEGLLKEIPKIDPIIMTQLEMIAKRPHALVRESAERAVKKILSSGLDFDPYVIRSILINEFKMGKATAVLVTEFMDKFRDMERRR
jgi:hypothetical protein